MTPTRHPARHLTTRITASLALALLALHAAPSLAATPTIAAPAAAQASSTATATSSMVAFDGVFIPALFLTGSGGKSAEAAAKANAALQRLLADWPQRLEALAAVAPGQAAWQQALATVARQLPEANALANQGRWEDSHEALEKVRQALHAARERLAIPFAPDRLTAYHDAMEKLAEVGSPANAGKALQRAAMLADFATARALWRQVEGTTFDPATYGLSTPRAAQFKQAMADETAALSRLSSALESSDDTALRQAAMAIKAPFVRGFTAFGWPAGETPALPR